MAIHRIEAEPEMYGAAAFLVVVHMVRNFAGRDKASRRAWQELLQHAAEDAEKLGNEFGRETAALIRRIMVMKPLVDPKQKN
jgi:hypothetical protein